MGRFDKQAIDTHGNAGTSVRIDQIGSSSRHSFWLVELLKRVGCIENHRTSQLLHFGYTAIVNNQILIAEAVIFPI